MTLQKLNQELKYSLENLEMIGDDNHSSGLLPVQEITKNKNLPPEQIIALENADKYGAHYVYFRQFENRPSVPQVYLYDFTDRLGIEEDELTNLHKQLYSSGQVPMFFVFTKKDVRIFNCFESPSKGKSLKYTPLTTIKIASDLSQKIDSKNEEKFKAFSGKSFDNGTFWENSKYSSQFKFSNSAYEKLLTELKQALKDIISQDILPANFARKIMVVSILIKYLEERKDEKGNKVFPENFFSRFSKSATKFTDVLTKKGAYLELLDYLAKHFNGGVFQLEDNERGFIQEKDLTRFGQFLDGDVDGTQFVFWRLYSFNDLPVELISNIYEEFLGKQPGVVYTPPYLVNFLLDEAMPLSVEETDFKILDPACGSGVFLVGAFRRLIYRWRKKNKWNYPDLDTLKKLLKENIFGVELNKEAADLTIFSLSLALCDELTPLQIWKDLRFDDLHKENIIHDDFFNVISDKRLQKDFDLIIGNPPFEAKLTEAAKRVETVKGRERKISVFLDENKIKDVPVKLPDNQIALLFLEQSIELCKKKGLVCLIQPSGPLLYNNSSFQFRQVLFNKYSIPQIIDFTYLSSVLYGNASVATSAIFIKNISSKKQSGIYHIVPKRTKSSKEKIFFEIDSYDFNYVKREIAISSPIIWKSNLIGLGTRLKNMLDRFNDFPRLVDYLKSQQKDNLWNYGEGFMRGKKNGKDAPFLNNKKSVLAKNFTTNGCQTEVLTEQLFVRPRKKSLYKGPSILIKEVIESKSKRIPIHLTESYTPFDSRILGINANGHQSDSLQELYNYLVDNNELFSFLISVTSSQAFISYSTAIRADDIYNLPYGSKSSAFALDKFEYILVSDYFHFISDFLQQGEKSIIAVQNVSEKELSEFGDTYCQVLKSVFKTIKPFQHFETDSYICFPFYFGKKPNIDFSNSDQAEKHIKQLIQKNSGHSLRLTRIVRLYEENVIYLIKPKKLRYWLKSIALRDADETFSDLRKQGY